MPVMSCGCVVLSLTRPSLYPHIAEAGTPYLSRADIIAGSPVLKDGRCRLRERVDGIGMTGVASGVTA